MNLFVLGAAVDTPRSTVHVTAGRTRAASRTRPAPLQLLLCSVLGALCICRGPAAAGRAQAPLPSPSLEPAGGRPPAATGRRPTPAVPRPSAVAGLETLEAPAQETEWHSETAAKPAAGSERALGRWTLESDGFELLRLPIELGDGHEQAAERVALEAGAEMSVLATRWRPIKNGDESRSRRQSYLRMRKHRAPLGLNAAAVLDAAERAVWRRLGSDFVLNDCVAIADFGPDLPRQELHRDIRREAIGCSTHGLLAPLSHGTRLHLVPGSHRPRGGLRGRFARTEVLTVNVLPGQLLLWDGMLVHAGDGGMEHFIPDSPNRLRLHAYVERKGEDRPYDDKGDRMIVETE
uniref:Uncharacterized protein n=1 Tax=Alexandrium monilatum TaxID=311494 RepID=A0A7S4PVD4_9DINO